MQFNKAIIVFEDNTTLWYLRLLERNYRHCYMILVSDSSFECLEINPMSNKIFFNTMHKIRLKSFLSGKRFVVVDCTYVPKKPIALGIFTCVEMVKRVLGIDNIFIQTPKKLYTYLQKIGKKSLTFEKNYFTTKTSRWD